MSAAANDTKRPSAPHRALGKGLDALLPRVQAPASPPADSPASQSTGQAASSAASPVIASLAAEAETGTPAGTPLALTISQIDRNPYQTRTNFDQRQIEELAASITANGVIQPILVRPTPGGRYQLVAGERRWLASQRAGKIFIPAYVRQLSDGQAMEFTIIENLQRADLNPIEQARAYERLGREFNLTQEQMATRTGKDRASVANFLRLLRLPESVQNKVAAGQLSFGHARALVALETPREIEKAAERIIALSLSVRQSETFIQGLLHPEKSAKKAAVEPPPVDPNVRAAQDRLQQALGMRVAIEDRNGRGRVIIEYARLEDFDALMDRIVGQG